MQRMGSLLNSQVEQVESHCPVSTIQVATAHLPDAPAAKVKLTPRAVILVSAMRNSTDILRSTACPEHNVSK